MKRSQKETVPAVWNQIEAWTGPYGEGPNGGVSFSLLSRFITCRDRMRVYAIEGLAPSPTFNHRIEFGSMWHICEDHYGRGQDWEDGLRSYCKSLCEKYRDQQQQVQHWYRICSMQFPAYLEFWKRHPDEKTKKVLMSETSFDVPYRVPGCRHIVRLRGKWDSVDLIGKGNSARVYIQENKSKGDINEQILKAQLSSGFDLQTMIYMVALMGSGQKGVAGVRYNVVRRPLSGGRYTIRQNKSETEQQFYDRLRVLFVEEDPAWFFMRWRIEISEKDVDRFRRECLDPLLRQMCDWWELSRQQEDMFDPPSVAGLHWRMPFGVYNSVADGGIGEVDEYLVTGSKIGLSTISTVFPEL